MNKTTEAFFSKLLGSVVMGKGSVSETMTTGEARALANELIAAADEGDAYAGEAAERPVAHLGPNLRSVD